MTLDEAIDTVAREVLVRLWERESDIGGPFHEDFPEVGETDFERVTKRAAVLLTTMQPQKAEYDQAYGVLSARAGEDREMSS